MPWLSSRQLHCNGSGVPWLLVQSDVSPSCFGVVHQEALALSCFNGVFATVYVNVYYVKVGLFSPCSINKDALVVQLFMIGLFCRPTWK